MSTWLFDLGNTRLKWAPLHADGPGPAHAIAHDGAVLPEGWDAALPARCTLACVASVAAPALATSLLEALAARSGRIARVRTVPALAGVRIAYAEPSRLGVDRFLALLAARARGQAPALVVGVGTALTIDLLDGAGRHRGGRIAPSPALMREALHVRAPHLPLAGGTYAEFADDTAAALASGCEGAALALVERSLAAATTLLGASPRVLLHGGGADAMRDALPQASDAPALVLEGMAAWLRAVG